MRLIGFPAIKCAIGIHSLPSDLELCSVLCRNYAAASDAYLHIVGKTPGSRSLFISCLVQVILGIPTAAARQGRQQSCIMQAPLHGWHLRICFHSMLHGPNPDFSTVSKESSTPPPPISALSRMKVE